MPTVSFASPASGATVSGTFSVSGSASDNVGVSKIEVRVDCGAYRLASGTTSWSLSISTSGYASGSHTLTARATDSSGNQAWAGRTVSFSTSTSPLPHESGQVFWGAWIGKQFTGTVAAVEHECGDGVREHGRQGHVAAAVRLAIHELQRQPLHVLPVPDLDDEHDPQPRLDPVPQLGLGIVAGQQDAVELPTQGHHRRDV